MIQSRIKVAGESIPIKVCITIHLLRGNEFIITEGIVQTGNAAAALRLINLAERDRALRDLRK